MQRNKNTEYLLIKQTTPPARKNFRKHVATRAISHSIPKKINRPNQFYPSAGRLSDENTFREPITSSRCDAVWPPPLKGRLTPATGRLYKVQVLARSGRERDSTDCPFSLCCTRAAGILRCDQQATTRTRLLVSPSVPPGVRRSLLLSTY